MPRDLPGAETPPLRLPPPPKEPNGDRQQAIQRLYAPLPTLERLQSWQSLPSGPLTLLTDWRAVEFHTKETVVMQESQKNNRTP